MGAVKDFYFEEISNGTFEDLDEKHFYQKWKGLREEEMERWMCKQESDLEWATFMDDLSEEIELSEFPTWMRGRVS